jgi:hypothetical protein
MHPYTLQEIARERHADMIRDATRRRTAASASRAHGSSAGTSLFAKIASALRTPLPRFRTTPAAA